METILCIDTPVQMISCTDTNGKITPIRFRFRDRNGELVTINIDKIISTDQEHGSLGANFICTARSGRSACGTIIMPMSGVWRALAVNIQRCQKAGFQFHGYPPSG